MPPTNGLPAVVIPLGVRPVAVAVVPFVSTAVSVQLTLVITWKVRAGERSMQGQPYLFNHVLPNFFFHCVTAYDILRHTGVELGKQDFLGKPTS